MVNPADPANKIERKCSVLREGAPALLPAVMAHAAGPRIGTGVAHGTGAECSLP